MSEVEFSQLAFTTALKAAKSGAAILKSHYLNLYKLSFEDKGNHDIVSLADREADAAIKEVILEQFPDHSFFSEEDKESGLVASDYQWIVDPLDGTNNFAIGMNTFVTLISLIYKQQPILSLIYNPLTDQYVWADDSHAYFNDQVLVKSSEPTNLHKIFLSLVGGYAIVDKIRSFLKFALTKQEGGSFRRIFNSWSPGVDFFSGALEKIQGFYLLESESYDLYQGIHILTKLGYLIIAPNGETIDYTKPDVLLPDLIIARDQPTLDFMLKVYKQWQKQASL